jgi:GNAT superfamily N-acetyltransferase
VLGNSRLTRRSSRLSAPFPGKQGELGDTLYYLVRAHPGFRPLAVFLRDSAGHIVAGAYGRTNWNWLHISSVWVAEGERGKGFGRELILAIEAAAAQRGCRQAHLDTFSYQARPFYERLGYRVFGELEDYPPGHARFFLRKQLQEG